MRLRNVNKIPIYHYEFTISILLSINYITFIRLYHTYIFYTHLIDFESLECKVMIRFDIEAVAALACATGGAQVGYSLFMVGDTNIKYTPVHYFRWGTGSTWPHPLAAPALKQHTYICYTDFVKC